MRRKICFILLFYATTTFGQTPTPRVAQLDPKLISDAQIAGGNLFVALLAHDAGLVNAVNDHDVRIGNLELTVNGQGASASLQKQINDLSARITKLEPQPPIPGNPAPTPVILGFVQASGGTIAATTLPFSSVTPPLVLTFSTGNWNLGPNGLSPAADNQSGRNITFSTPVHLVQVVYSGASIKIQDTTPGAVSPNPNAVVTSGVPTGTQVVLSTNWPNAVTNITIGGTGATPAPALQMQSFTVTVP